MATTAYTVDAIELKLKEMLGWTAATTRETAKVIEAINDAMLEIHLKGGPRGWEWMLEDDSSSTTSGTNYITLDADVGVVLKDTVRDSTSDRMLEWVPNYGNMLAMDPDQSRTGAPQMFSIIGDAGASPDGDQRRMVVYPTPDSTYTLKFLHVRIPATLADGANAIAEVPDAYHRTVLYAAAMILWEDIGQVQDAEYYRAKFMGRIRDMHRMQTSGPTFVRLARPAPASYISEDVTTTVS